MNRSTVVLVLVSVFAGVLIVRVATELGRMHCEAEHAFVNSEALCGTHDVIKKTGYGSLRSKLQSRVASAHDAGVSTASIYFRDLVHGPVFGINELTPFAPASLLKLPTALVFLNAEEMQPGVLAAKIRYEGTASVDLQRIQPPESAREGETYTIEQLVQMMLSYSDNASYQALDAFLRKETDREELRKQTFQELGLFDPETRAESTLSVRGYASLYTLLFNASYLDAQHSEQVLSWLADSSYGAGLVAGVPPGMAVAHKFGERIRDDDTKELHDCGIIYYPGNPYLLCVMTRGDDWDALTHLIADISGMVYQEVDSRRL